MSRQPKPCAVEIFGYWFSIEFVDSIVGEPGTDGCFYPGEKLIKIVNNEDEWENSLRHEVVHAVLHVSGHSALFTDVMEESLTILLENGLADLFSINKHSLRWKFSKR